MTIMSSVPRDAAQAAVVSDREAQADLVLGVAVADTVAKLRELRHTPPAYRIARVELLWAPALKSADRILGRST